MQREFPQHAVASGQIAGPGSAAIKYDMITALLVTCTCADAVTARLALRLSLLITARYNWRAAHFAVGQNEMAAMWGVTTRTAKREVSAMRARGWIVVKRPAARGRVASYAISFAEVLRDTTPYWSAVGPDFAARMAGAPEPDAHAETNVVPLHAKRQAALENDGTAWPDAARYLQQQDPRVFEAWFAQLRAVEQGDDRLHLAAPGRFQAEYIQTHFATRILAAVTQVDPQIRTVTISAVS